MLDLSKICLWSLLGKPDQDHLLRLVRVLRYCDSLATWQGEKLLFTVLEPPGELIAVPGLRVIQIPQLDWEPWEITVVKLVHVILERYPFAMAIHDDGFPIDVNLWSDTFLDYDVIAAPWERNGFVGSGGCALTSSKFNNFTSQLPWYDGKRYGDEWLCIEQRERLMEQGVKFAPAEVAIKYCTETMGNGEPSFAYHGRAHSPHKHKTAWEKLEAWEAASGL